MRESTWEDKSSKPQEEMLVASKWNYGHVSVIGSTSEDRPK